MKIKMTYIIQLTISNIQIWDMIIWSQTTKNAFEKYFYNNSDSNQNYTERQGFFGKFFCFLKKPISFSENLIIEPFRIVWNSVEITKSFISLLVAAFSRDWREIGFNKGAIMQPVISKGGGILLLEIKALNTSIWFISWLIFTTLK